MFLLLVIDGKVIKAIPFNDKDKKLIVDNWNIIARLAGCESKPNG
jgi:hypothetical protein